MTEMLRTVVVLASMLAVVTAQFQLPPPAHATLLNPNTGTVRFEILHLEDVVVCVGRNGIGSYSRSVDGGRTWHVVDQFLALFRIEDAGADGDLIAVTGTNGLGPQVVVSRNRGLSWEPAQSVGAFSQTAAFTELSVEVFGTTICVFWSEPATGSVSMQRSIDAGLTWLTTPITLGSVAPPPTAALFWMNLNVIVDGPVLHVFWVRRTNIGALGQHQISTDGGMTWLALPLTTPSPPLPGAVLQPFAVGNANLLLLGNHGTPLQRSTDGGVTWSDVNSLLMPRIYDVAVLGQTVVVVGVDFTTPITWYIQTSLDGGLTWQSPPFQSPASAGFDADAFIEGSKLYVNFRNGTTPAWSIVAFSEDLGVSWRNMQSDVNQFAPGPRRNLHMRFGGVNPSAGSVHAYVGLGSTQRGLGTMGSGGQVPRLDLASLPILGAATSLELTNTVGGTVGVLGWSLQPPSPQPLVGGTLWLQAPILPTVITLNGAPGVPGAGAFSQSFVVPNAAVLAGTVVISQAIVLDGQANNGLALSNAIEWFVN